MAVFRALFEPLQSFHCLPPPIPSAQSKSAAANPSPIGSLSYVARRMSMASSFSPSSGESASAAAAAARWKGAVPAPASDGRTGFPPRRLPAPLPAHGVSCCFLYLLRCSMSAPGSGVSR